MKTPSWRIVYVMCVLFLIVPLQLVFAQEGANRKENQTVKPFSFPLQLEMHVTFDPTAFPSGSKHYLIYELYLTNFSSSPINLRRIELIDAASRNIQPFVTFSPEQLQNMLQPLGGVVPRTTEKLTLNGGETAIVFIEVESDRKKSFPAKLIHRVVTDKDSLDGAIVSTAHVRLQSLVPPLHGANWIAADGPGNDAENHHRRGVVVLGGHAVDSRRDAIEWKKVKDSVSFSGDPRNVHSYFCYAENVFAVADGRVIRAKDGLPDNVPGHGEAFHPAAPLNFETIAGNSITIDLGNGHYAYYMHLQPGSLLVKAGDRVHRGQILARIGASGDAREPHLHFEVTTSPKLLFGEGIPYSITRYRLNAQKYQGIHLNELPLDKQIVDFGEQNHR